MWNLETSYLVHNIFGCFFGKGRVWYFGGRAASDPEFLNEVEQHIGLSVLAVQQLALVA